MMNINKWLLNSTLFGVFSEALYIDIGIDFKLIYIIVLMNNLLLIAASKTYYLNKLFNFGLLILFFISVFCAFIYDTDPVKLIFQFVGVFVLGNYFFNLFRFLSVDYRVVFSKYVTIAYFLSIIGLLFLVFYLVSGIEISYEMSKLPFFGYRDLRYNERVRSLLLEPAHFAGIILPAFFYTLSNFKTQKKKFFVFFFTLLFTFSTIAYIGLFLSFLFVGGGRSIIIKIVVAVFVLLGFFYAYTVVKDFKMRLDDTLVAFSDNRKSEVGDLNLSTYTLYANYFVTTEVLKDNPIFGHGVASHPESYRTYIKDMYSSNSTTLNMEDANSLMLRILSEMGVLGFLLVAVFISRNYVNDVDFIAKSILFYFFYKLFREGHYFSPEMYFFVVLYLQNMQSFKLKNK